MSKTGTTYREIVSQTVDESKKLLVKGSYSLLAASAILPVLAVNSTNPAAAISILAGILGGIGGNLIANMVQGAYDKAKNNEGVYDIADLARILESQIKENANISDAVALLVKESGALDKTIDLVKDLPSQWDEFSTNLLNQIKNLPGTKIIVDSIQIHRLEIRDVVGTIEGMIIEYLHMLELATDDLRLGTIDPKFEIDSPIKLSQIYVPPLIQSKAPYIYSSRGNEEPIPVICDIAKRTHEENENRGLVFLGGPGSGKTAFIDRLANILSVAIKKNLQQSNTSVEGYDQQKNDIPGWTGRLLLPVRVSLQEFAARKIHGDIKTGKSGLLWDHICDKLRLDSLSDFSASLNMIMSGRMRLDGSIIDKREKGANCIVLLDGLDEVPQHQRPIVEESILDFSSRFSCSIILITCRTYSWQHFETSVPRYHTPSITHFPVHEIIPFLPIQISQFIEKWYDAVQSLKHLPNETVEYRVSTLEAATRLPALIPLAEKPLLLTLMATLHTSRGELPHNRPTLYKECVDLLLEIWQRSKDLHIGDKTTIEGGLLEEFGLSSDVVERVLQRIAFELHVAGMPEKEDNFTEHEPLVTAESLRKAFRPMLKNSFDEADRLVQYLQRRAGIIEFVGEDSYRFPHRTFQEYLAACLLLDEPDAPANLEKYFLTNSSWWGEVYSLAIGRQSLIGYSRAVQILDETYNKAIKTTDIDASAFLTLLNIGRDIGLNSRQNESRQYFDLVHNLIRSFFEHSSVALDSRIVYERGSLFTDQQNVLIPHVIPMLRDQIIGDTVAVYIRVYGTPVLTPELISMLPSTNPQFKARLARALGCAQGNDDARNILESFVKREKNMDVVIQGIRSLTIVSGSACTSILVNLLNNNNHKVTRAAIEGLGLIGDNNVVSELCDRAELADHITGKPLIKALSVIRSIEAIDGLIDLLDIDELKDYTANALVDIGDEAMPRIRDAYENAESEEMMSALREIIIRIAQDSGESDPLLWREDDTDLSWSM